jgi:phage terminase small subunit
LEKKLMIQRGRKSATSLSIVPPVDRPRPEPPEDLTPEQAEIWRTTVAALRVDWFGPETWPLLACYCTHVSIALLLAKAIAEADLEADLDRFDKLTAMHGRQTAAIIATARQLRLTKRSSSDSRTVKHVPGGGRRAPWELTP